jgi:hypothetical protein
LQIANYQLVPIQVEQQDSQKHYSSNSFQVAVMLQY